MSCSYVNTYFKNFKLTLYLPCITRISCISNTANCFRNRQKFLLKQGNQIYVVAQCTKITKAFYILVHFALFIDEKLHRIHTFQSQLRAIFSSAQVSVHFHRKLLLISSTHFHRNKRIHTVWLPLAKRKIFLLFQYRHRELLIIYIHQIYTAGFH